MGAGGWARMVGARTSATAPAAVAASRVLLAGTDRAGMDGGGETGRIADGGAAGSALPPRVGEAGVVGVVVEWPPHAASAKAMARTPKRLSMFFSPVGPCRRQGAASETKQAG
jgi:hypothetical protein